MVCSSLRRLLIEKKKSGKSPELFFLFIMDRQMDVNTLFGVLHTLRPFVLQVQGDDDGNKEKKAQKHENVAVTGVKGEGFIQGEGPGKLAVLKKSGA